MLDVKEDTQKPRKSKERNIEWLYLTNNYLATLEKRFLSGLYIINTGSKIEESHPPIMTFDFTFLNKPQFHL